ncbi:MAG: alpha-amylase family glycosyl hydrolase [Bacteroidota bacterium]
MLFRNKILLLQIPILLFSFFSDNTFIKAQNTTDNWWKKTTIYQIYPRSFYDSNGDGIGDLQGVIQKLDYIKDLGVETIWISPFFSSPQKDFGYDISDYYSIAPEYGDISICDQLIKEVHNRNMKIIFDMVMNHTSDAHTWFQESALSNNNAKADWYVWKTGKGKRGTKKPNNWKSMVGGSGWHYNPVRKQFYWASFLPFQPDLNYRNPEVKKNMLDITRFWIGKGVDGFRLDIFSAIYEDSTFTDNPFSFKILPDEENPDGFFQKAKYNINNTESFELAAELKKIVNEKGDKYLVGEVFGDASILKQYCYYNGKPGLNSVFLFKTLNTPLRAKSYRKLVSSFEKNFPEPFLPTYVYSNHDRKRSISRLKNNIEKAKLLALFQYTVRGIPYTYYGEELGMPQSNIPLKKGKDPMAERLKWMPQFMANLSQEAINRDGCRTPMLWNNDTKAGFTTSVNPWLPVSDNYKNLNVEQQKADSTSLLNFYTNILALRKSIPAMHSGSIEIAEEFCNRKIFAYYRTYENEKYLVILNMSKRSSAVILPKGKTVFAQNVLNNKLKAYGGIVIKIE